MSQNKEKSRRDRHARLSVTLSRLLFIGGVLCLLYFAVLFIGLNTVTAFNLFWVGLGLALIAMGAVIRLVNRKNRTAARRLSMAVIVAAALVLALVVFVEARVIAGSLSQPEPGARYMLVLGARVKPEGPSVLLGFRIDKAAEYLNDNPDTVAILCGGQGDDEPMSEAQAMYEGLTERGIDPARLIIEDRSVNTEGNINNAMELIDDADAPVVITTTGYHVYRALWEARRQGLTNVSGNPARCAWFTPLNYYAREFFAVLRDWIFKR